LPEHSAAIQSFSLSWLDQNKAEVLALSSYKKIADPAWGSSVDGQVARFASRFAALTDEARRGECSTFFMQVKRGEQNVEKLHPGVSGTLSTFLASHPLSPLETENYSFVMGCTKQASNRALDQNLTFDLSAVQSFCACSWKARQDHSSAEERALEARYVNDPKSLMALPHVRRYAPYVAACSPSR
jgi:hypothetical protein